MEIVDHGLAFACRLVFGFQVSVSGRQGAGLDECGDRRRHPAVKVQVLTGRLSGLQCLIFPAPEATLRPEMVGRLAP